MMKKILVSLICLVSLALSTAFATEYKPYENTSGRYSVEVPAEFTVAQSPKDVTQMIATNKETGAIMSIKVTVMNNGLSGVQQEAQLQQALPVLINRLKSQGATIIQSGPTKISGHKGISFAYTVTRGGIERYQEQYLVVNNNGLYNLTFMALAGTGSLYQPMFEHAVKSMVLK